MTTSATPIYERPVRYDRHLYIATVYRTINILAEWGLLSRIELGDGRARHEEDHGGHHEHLVDVDTGKVVELSEPATENLLREVAKRCCYRLVNYRLELFGEVSSEATHGSPRRPAQRAPVRRLRTVGAAATADRGAAARS